MPEIPYTRYQSRKEKEDLENRGDEIEKTMSKQTSTDEQFQNREKLKIKKQKHIVPTYQNKTYKICLNIS